MSRTLGFFLGSAVVFALLVIVMGQPVTLAPPTVRHPVGQSTETTTVRLPEAKAQTITTVDVPKINSPAPVSRQSVAPVAKPEQVLTHTESPAATTTESVSTTAAVAEPVVDENALTAQWMASARTSAVDNAVAIPATNDAPTLPVDGSDRTLPVAATNRVDWFPVWDPFHSELSANAFARRLERITGLDYRVIKTDTNNYRVAMAYSSEDQRMINVAMIEEATGLSVSGGSR